MAAAIPAAATAAKRPVYTPANFTDEPESLQKMVKFPDIPADANQQISIFCAAYVQSDGRLARNACFDGEATRPFSDAINSASRHARIRPATENGQAVGARMQYMMLFVQQNGKRAVGAYANWGAAADSYGRAYTAPQVMSGDAADARNSLRGCKPGEVVWVKGRVDARGAGSQAGVFQSAASKACVDDAVAAFEKTDFIPAFSDNGKPVAVNFVEVFWAPSAEQGQ